VSLFEEFIGGVSRERKEEISVTVEECCESLLAGLIFREGLILESL
jgi:hypothetical protein